MKGTLAIVMCDDEYGCADYMTDYYEQGATNWREIVPAGWQYDPHRDTAFCPQHASTPEQPEGENRG